MATQTTSVIEVLRGLRAVRRFDLAPVPQEAVDDLLEVARWTGSASNRQPWELVLVGEPETLRALATVSGPPGPRHLAGAPLAIVLVMSGRATEFDEGRLSREACDCGRAPCAKIHVAEGTLRHVLVWTRSPRSS